MEVRTEGAGRNGKLCEYVMEEIIIDLHDLFVLGIPTVVISLLQFNSIPLSHHLPPLNALT